MNVIPLKDFYEFKSYANIQILLFNKKIKNKVKKNNNLKKNCNKLNLFLNKVNKENYYSQCKKYIEDNTFDRETLKIFTTEIFKKILCDGEFIESYFLFYKTIIDNYYNYCNYDFTYFINLVESKFIMDFSKESVLLSTIINNLISIPDDVTLTEKTNYLKTHKFNNLKLIYYLIKHNILDKKIIPYIYEILSNQITEDSHEALYLFITYNEDLEYLKTCDLSSFNLRISTLFSELQKKLENNIITHVIKTKNKVNKNLKTCNKTLIINIIEEYLFMEDIDEVKIFIETYVLKKNLQRIFVETSLIYGKSNDKEKEIKNMLENVSHILKKKPVLFNRK